MIKPTLEALGDGALLIRLGDTIDDGISDTAIALAERLRAHYDAAPAYASVCVRFDVDRPPDAAELLELIDASLAKPPAMESDRVVEIPVCYGGEFGPDLNDVATHAKLSIEDVITRHAAGTYTVAMLGFMPGFPYLRGLPSELNTPRRSTPRTHVPAGSVAIGGAQTGIYPRELPGGWQLIGRTPLHLFDATRENPALLRPGQRVRFVPIDTRAFAET
ncbi:MAG TPA: 5-oxoprolinase subunit PxpB [Rudaea sp.]|nr:5-oxoprolinase subunit PxpB [Rudaea sp.]